jgi:hypothetical protein
VKGQVEGVEQRKDNEGDDEEEGRGGEKIGLRDDSFFFVNTDVSLR